MRKRCLTCLTVLEVGKHIIPDIAEIGMSDIHDIARDRDNYITYPYLILLREGCLTHLILLETGITNIPDIARDRDA